MSEQHRDCDELLTAVENQLRKKDWPAAQAAFALSQAWLAFQLFSSLARFRQELKKAEAS